MNKFYCNCYGICSFFHTAKRALKTHASLNFIAIVYIVKKVLFYIHIQKLSRVQKMIFFSNE